MCHEAEEVKTDYEASGFPSTAAKVPIVAAGLIKVAHCSGWLQEVLWPRGVPEGVPESFGLVVFFVHHLRVMDRLQQQLVELGVLMHRIDGSTSTASRQLKLTEFRARKVRLTFNTPSLRAC